MKKTLIVIVILLVLGAGLFWYMDRTKQAQTTQDQISSTDSGAQTQQQESPQDVQTALQPTSTPPAATTTPPKPVQTPAGTAQGTFSSGEAAGDGGPDIQVVEIDYDGSAFSPSTITIHANDYVIFKNKSTANVWPASDPHPTHTDYPGFDALKAVAPGGSYKFQFAKVGTWGFHNHLNPSQRGSVIVTQ